MQVQGRIPWRLHRDSCQRHRLRCLRLFLQNVLRCRVEFLLHVVQQRVHPRRGILCRQQLQQFDCLQRHEQRAGSLQFKLQHMSGPWEQPPVYNLSSDQRRGRERRLPMWLRKLQQWLCLCQLLRLALR